MKPFKAHALVIDQDATHRQLLQSIVEQSSEGVTVTAVDDPVEAFALIEQQHFWVVLIDFSISEIKAFNLTEKIKKHENGLDSLIIFTATTDIDSSVMRKAYELGAVDYLPNPIEPSILMNKLKTLLEVEVQKNQLQNLIEEMHATQQDLKRSNEDLQNFSAVVSHDLQAPLNKLTQFVNILHQDYQDKFDETGETILNRIVDATSRMHSLINNVLEFAQLDGHRDGHHKTDLNETMTAVLFDLEPLIEESQCKLVIDPLPVIKADGPQMYQLFQNLVSNAIKYRAADKQPFVKVRHEVDSKNQALNFSVEDNGIGFDMEQHQQIFDPYHRLTTENFVEGHGLGLATVKRIVERHHGQLSVDSRPGEGSTFRISLPLNLE